MKSISSSFVAVVLCCACSTSRDAAGPISTDRPGFLFSPALVPVRALQLELGAPSLATTRSGGSRTTVVGASAALRYGLSHDVELRASLPSYLSSHADSGVDDDGLGDGEVGAKLRVADGDGAWLPQSALIASIRLPTGDDAFTAREPGYALFAAEGWSLGGCGLVGLLGLTRTPNAAGGDDDAAIAALLLSRPWTDAWTGYAEAAWNPSLEDGGADGLYAGIGAIGLLSNDVQLDVAVDRGLNDESTDWVGGIGISFRW